MKRCAGDDRIHVGRLSIEMSDQRPRWPSYLVNCLLAVVLFGGYVLFDRLQADSSATMAPNLVLGR